MELRLNSPVHAVDKNKFIFTITMFSAFAQVQGKLILPSCQHSPTQRHTKLFLTAEKCSERKTSPSCLRFINYRKERVQLHATSQKQIQKLFPMKFVVLIIVIMRIVVYQSVRNHSHKTAFLILFNFWTFASSVTNQLTTLAVHKLCNLCASYY